MNPTRLQEIRDLLNHMRMRMEPDQGLINNYILITLGLIYRELEDMALRNKDD